MLGIATPIADISTKSPDATGTRPTSPKTPVVMSSSATAASTMTARPKPSTLSRLIRPTSSLPLICPTAIRPIELRPNSRLKVWREAP
ncbi:hypothetical protein SMICM17S_10536 [Streptomyces microflavus]